MDLFSFVDGHLYWTQLGLAQVEKSDLDGRNRETVFNLKGFKFFGIALHRNEIFLTDWTLSAYVLGIFKFKIDHIIMHGLGVVYDNSHYNA